jgi:transcriptional regulator with XRE-family HTH domain
LLLTKDIGSLFMKSLTNKLFAANLDRILRAKGWRYIDLAERTGIDKSSISGWKSGRSFVDPKTIDLLAYVLEVEHHEFFLPIKPGESPPEPKFIEREKVTLESVASALLQSLGFEPPKRLKKRDKSEKK